MEDSRFSHIKNDPKFRRIPKKERKVKIDKRFQSMFNDKKFKVKYTTDIRGRPVNQTSNEDLRRYYELSSDDECSDGSSSGTEEQETGKFVKLLKDNSVSELEDKHKSDKVIADPIKKKLHNLDIDYARGESTLLSDSSSDDEDSEGSISEADEVDHKWGELDNDAGLTDEATHRLAACNMDWDRIRATDLIVLFNSFLPSGSIIKSVAIYPSEFGKARMEEEELKGPTELVETKVENNNEKEDGSSYHMEKLRQYQLNRLKYYYAVITFDNAISASKIYSECDGMEYESSSIKIDLRFIPDDMDFEVEPKEYCDKLPDVSKYQPRFFTTTALQQAKVDLTWDETNPDRIELSQKLSSGEIDNISKADLQNYLAVSSGSETSESDNENAPDGSDEENGSGTIDKYKSLLQEIEDNEKSKKNKDVEMEISWGIDLKEKTEKLVKDKMNSTEQKTPFQKYLDKRKEKRKKKKSLKKGHNEGDGDSEIPSDIDMNDPYFADEFNNPEFKKSTKKSKRKDKLVGGENDEEKHAELELLLMNEESNQKHFNLKKIQDNENGKKLKKKGRSMKNDMDNEIVDTDFQVNVQDERFSALFSSHHYNIDPTNPHYKKTRAMETLEREKLKRRTEEVDKLAPGVKTNAKKIKTSAELSMLVKSVKRKTNDYLNK